MPKAFKSCPKSSESPDLVTLVICYTFHVKPLWLLFGQLLEQFGQLFNLASGHPRLHRSDVKVLERDRASKWENDTVCETKREGDGGCHFQFPFISRHQCYQMWNLKVAQFFKSCPKISNNSFKFKNGVL